MTAVLCPLPATGWDPDAHAVPRDPGVQPRPRGGSARDPRLLAAETRVRLRFAPSILLRWTETHACASERFPVWLRVAFRMRRVAHENAEFFKRPLTHISARFDALRRGGDGRW